ncbi:MAG: c-type cytochrome domain-containing protein [Phycisphaerales bacterium]
MSDLAASGLIDEMRSALANPSTRHAMLVHFPVAMSSIGIVVAFAAALWRKRRAARVVAIAWFAALAVAAFLAKQSGGLAEGALSPRLPDDAFIRVDLHEEMGELIWLFAAGTAALFAVSLVRDRIVRFLALVLAIAAAVFCAGWTAVTAHHGGALVYTHGAGVAPVAPEGDANDDEDPVDASGRGGVVPGDVASDRLDGSEGPGQASPTAPIAPTTPIEGSLGRVADLRDPRVVFFNEAIEPLLAARCQSCHRAVRPKSRLDLTTRRGALAGGKHGLPAIVPGDPEGSLLIQVVRGTNEEIDAMPPDDPLPAEEIALLVQWIRDGAIWGDEP